MTLAAAKDRLFWAGLTLLAAGFGVVVDATAEPWAARTAFQYGAGLAFALIGVVHIVATYPRREASPATQEALND